jgi:hypothetical protein
MFSLFVDVIICRGVRKTDALVCVPCLFVDVAVCRGVLSTDAVVCVLRVGRVQNQSRAVHQVEQVAVVRTVIQNG